jgi:integrase/recombinase XerD
MATKQRRTPLGCYWRGDTLWGRKRVKGREFRWSLHTDDPKIARQRYEAGSQRALADAHHGDGRLRLDEVVEAWAKWLTRSVSPKTKARYLCSLAQMASELEGRSLPDIDGKLVAEIIRKRLAVGVTNSTIKRDLVALSSVINFAIDQGWAESNPVLPRMRRLKERRDPIVLPSSDDIAFVVRHAPGMMADMIRAALATGARQDELVQARHGQLDHRRRQLTLIGKGNKQRVISLEPFGGVSLFAAFVPRGQHLFWHGAGEPYRNFPSNFRQVVRRLVRIAERKGIAFRPFRFHDLRHRHAVDWLRSGRSIYDLQMRLGHSSVQVTEIYLDFLTPEEQAEARRGAVAAGSIPVFGGEQSEKEVAGIEHKSMVSVGTKSGTLKRTGNKKWELTD